MHPSLSDLCAYRDDELPAARSAQVALHLATCPACQAQLAQLRAQRQQVQAHFSALSAPRHPPPPAPAFATFKTRYLSTPKQEFVTMLKSFFAKRFVWAAASLVLVLAVALSFPPVQAWAGQFLGLFRVQQITVLPIDSTRFTQITDNQTMAEQISRMFAESFKVTREPGEPQSVADAAAASQLAGFAVRLPAGLTPAQLTVQPGGAFEMTIDAQRAQGMLNEMGRSDLQLPASLQGAVISVDIPTGVSAAFGECPTPRKAERPDDEDRDWYGFRTCTLLAQIPSPSINTPPDLDVAQLAELGLQLVGMSEAEARAFSQRVDWATTLVIPLPTDQASYVDVTVDGVPGTLMYPFSDTSEQRYTLLWVKDGVIYALNGFGLPNSAVELANTLK